MIDPDHFKDGDKPAETQAKRIALTLDIQRKYVPLFEEVLVRPMDDPNRTKDLNNLINQQKKEMDKRYAEATEKPVIRSIEMSKEGHLIKHRTLTPHTFVFNIGANVVPCPQCGEPFFKSKKHKKYCSTDCEERAKQERYIKKRREKNQSAHK